MARKAAPKGDNKKKKKVSGVKGMPARGKKKAAGGTDPRGVIGIIVLCLGLLALVSQFIPSSGGFLNHCVLLMRGLGGRLCLLLPLVVCWAGVVLVFFAERRLSPKPMVCSALVFLFVETMLQLFQVNSIASLMLGQGYQPTYLNFLICSYKDASSLCTGGGLIGALLAWPLVQALDIWGSVIVLIFAVTIALMVMTGVSFSHVGMYLSEWIDDIRVEIAEQREERAAARAVQEEEMLRRETELAAKRQQKREAREKALREQQEAQRLMEEQLRAKAQSAAQEAPQQEEQPAPAPKRKAKKKAAPAPAAQENPAWDGEVPISHEPVRAAKHAPRRAAAAGRSDLYIERGDEFTRESIDERTDPRDGRRRGQFSIEEAEQAFLYGMNAQGTAQTDHSIYARPAAQSAPVHEPAAYENGYAAEYTPVQNAPVQESPYPVYDEEPAYPEYAGEEQADAPAAYQPDEAPAYQMDEEMAYAADAPAGEEAAVSYDEPALEDDPEDEDGMPAFMRGYNAAAEQAQPARRRSERMQGEGVPSSIPARGVTRPAQGARSGGQDVLAAQQAAVQDQTIVQLRGSRLDGTPVVLPKKDVHEAPKIEEETYNYPPIDLLERSASTRDPNIQAKIEAGSRKLLDTLESFGVQAKLTHVTHGPAITRYELQPAPGVKVSRIVGLVDDIALNMASDGVRIEAPIPGKPAVGIEIPNEKTEMVSLRDVLESPEMTREKSPTAVALGKGISGAPVVADLAKMPHVLIAGATGSGKSVCINTIINSIIYRASPKEVRLILIDPKVVELSVYNGIPHLLVPVVTDPKKASAALSWAVVEMEHRYKRFETMGVRNIKGYNAAIGPDEEPMSSIIVIIDELADLMMVAPGEVEDSICRLAQLARAAGIHLVIATQRPSVNVITGVIKANIPSRIAFAVSSQIDSRTILDAGGAEKLLGKGDMLYAPQGAGKPTRVQGCFLSDEEVERIVSYVRGAHTADYNEDVIEQMNSAAEEEKAAAGEAPSGAEPVDEMLAKAIELAIDAGQISISMLQRRLRVGYARAGRLVDEMTLRGIAGEAEGPTKPRTVLITREEWKRMQENEE